MTRIRIIPIIQISIILIYFILTLFSIILQPIYLILGILCIFIIPGYNLINIFKPNYTTIQKIGYITIISLAITNIFMFFYYIFLYNPKVFSYGNGFIFDSFLLTTSLQILNLSLIFINEIKILKNKDRNSSNTKTHVVHKSNFNFKYAINNYNLKSLISYIFFFLSLTFLCISTYYSSVPDNTFWTNYIDYRSNFIFFSRVPFTFYIFLTILIVCLVYIVLFTDNKYLKLSSISIFIYTLWILPYLQIKNFFSWDSQLLYNLYNFYIEYGFFTRRHYSMTQIYFDTGLSHRYSTTIFTAIFLVNITRLDLGFILWFIYPLIYISIPFFLYANFTRNLKNKEEISNKSNFFILTILALITPQFIKFAHSATTGVIGIYVFLILIVEFYSLINNRYSNKKNIIFIVFLFLFQCLTHTEEAIYFLILVFLYGIYQILINQKSNNFKSLKEREKRKIIRNNTILLTLLIFIFYFTQEFFGWLIDYIYIILPRENAFRDTILSIYSNSKFTFIASLPNIFTLSYIIIFLIFIGIPMFFLVFYILSLKSRNLITRSRKFGVLLLKFIHKKIIKVTSTRYFLIFLLIFIFVVLLIIDWIIFPFLNEKGILLVIELVLISLIYIINIFFFILGIKHYRIKNIEQHYYIITILCTCSIFIIFFIFGNFYVGIYVLSFRFFSIFVFCNLMIIESIFFKNFMKKNDIFIVLFLVLIIFSGVFYSLRTLAYG